MRGDLKFSEGLLKIYDAAYSKDGWTDAMECCRLATLAKHTVFYAYGLCDEITFSVEKGSPTLQPIAWTFDAYNREFRERGVTGYDDIGAAFMQKAPVGAPIKDTDIWPIEWLKDREEVNFVRDRTGVFRRLYLNTSSDPLFNAGMHFWYNEDISELPSNDIATAALFGPHLAKAFDIARWASSLRRKHQAVLGALNKIELGVCITDRLGRIILENNHANDILSERDGLWCDQSGQLVSSNAEITSSIKDAIHNIIQTSSGKNEASSFEFSIPRRGADNPLLLIASPLRDADMELESNLQGCLITIVDTDRASNLRLDAFGKAYAFTPTEQKVANLLVVGFSTPEVGEELGIATSTTRTHTKAVFQKTNSKNRVNLVWRALQFTPPVI